MKRSALSKATFALTTIFISACLEPYTPSVSDVEVDLLVIDGFLDSSDGSAVVKLTKASRLDDDGPAPRVQNANVSVEGEDGSSFDLAEDTAGVYTMTAIPINTAVRYRINLKVNASEYASDFQAIKFTPEIDSLTRGFGADGTTIYITTHDDSEDVQYFRWDFSETYEYRSRLVSQFKVVNKQPVFRTDADRIDRCFKTLTSSKIYVTSTADLNKAVVYKFPLINLPPSNRKLYVVYSALVKQRAVSKSEYAFLDQLQKTTEGIGTLFDPQPSQAMGNIKNMSGGPAPLGYFAAGNSTSKRIFVRYVDLPQYLKHQDLADCSVDTICIPRMPAPFICSKDFNGINGSEYIIEALTNNVEIIGYTQTSAGCADCRIAGGTVTKPSYWP